MTKYLLLLRLDRGKLLETVGALRNLPKNPSSGVDVNYTMNIFGTWHLAVWFSSDKSAEAIDFINRKIGQIPGVVDAFPVAAFPHTGHRQEREETLRDEESE